jgi:integrase
MAIYKRGKIYWYKFVWNGELIRESTKQGNDKVARQMEAAHRTRLAKEKDERADAAKRLGFNSSAVLRCPECDDWFPLNRATAGADRQKYCSPACAREREKKNTRVPTLLEFCEQRFEPWAKSTTVPKTWLDFYRVGLRAIKAHNTLAGLRLDEITSENAAEFAAHRQSQGKGLQISTVNSSLRILRRVLRVAAEWGLIQNVPKIKRLPGERHRERVLTVEEEARFLGAAAEPLSSIAAVLADTGMRPEECYRLCWETITWTNGRNGTLLITHGKTKAARRVLPFTPRVRAILEARYENARRPEEGYVWPATTKSGHVEPCSLKRQHRKALKGSKVRPFVLYSLRHTFLTRLGESGCDAWTLARIAGHSSIAMSARYVHPSEDAVLNAVEKLGGHKTGHSQEEPPNTAEREKVLSATHD